MGISLSGYRTAIHRALIELYLRDLDLRHLTQPGEILGRNAVVGQDQVAVLDAAEAISRLGADFAAVDDQHSPFSCL